MAFRSSVQHSNPTPSMPDADVIVVGAGPAGSTAAISLARAGTRVLLVDKSPFPREKACGDALLPDAMALLERLGLLDVVERQGQRSRGVRIYSPRNHAVDIEGRCLCLPRKSFDALLVEAAVEAGAELRTHTEAVSFRSGRAGAEVTVRWNGREDRLRAPLVILASGASAKTLARFGVEHRSSPSAVALRAYFRLNASVPQDLLQIWYERSVLPGYAWIFPTGDHVFNVGAGVFYGRGKEHANLRNIFDRFQTQCPGARDMLEGAVQLGPIRGAPIRTSLTGSTPSAPRLLLAGETLGTTYSFSGEGIGKAMETGLIAARVACEGLTSGRLDESLLAEFRRSIETLLASRFRAYDIAQSWLRHPLIVDAFTWRACRSRRIRGLLADVLNETRPPTEVLSLPGLVKAALLP